MHRNLDAWGICLKKKEKLHSSLHRRGLGLFAISHLMTLLDIAKTLETPLIVIRALAHLTVIFALYKYSVQTQTNSVGVR